MKRKQNDQLLIYGVHAVEEAISAGKDIDKILFQKGLNNDRLKALRETAKSHHIPSQNVPEVKLHKMVPGKHQGVAAYLSAVPFASLDRVIHDCFSSGTDPKILVLDGVTDVRNLGAIARSAECANFHAILLPMHGSARINDVAIKTSAGALHHIPVCRSQAIELDLKLLAQSGLQVFAVQEDGDSYYWEENLTGPLALVMGDEGKGISKRTAKYCTASIKIPEVGQISSLNVSVATGIVLFDCLRQEAEFAGRDFS